MAISHDCAITLALFVLVCSTSMAHSPALAEQPLGLPAGAQNEEPAAETGGHAPLTEAQKLASCMDLWEPATHMSKTLWKTVCKRIQTKN
jgi:hypothetical protein